MAELLLDVALVDLCGGGKTRAQGVPGVEPQAFGRGQVGAQAGIESGALDQPDDMLVVQAALERALSVAGDAHQHSAEADLRVMQPLLQGVDWAGLVAGAADDFRVAPAGLAAQGGRGTGLKKVDPAAAVGGIVPAVVQVDDLGSGPIDCGR